MTDPDLGQSADVGSDRPPRDGQGYRVREERGVSILTSEAVDDLMKKCVFGDDEPMDNMIRVEGIIHDYGFHPDRIETNQEAIGALLAELPDEFHSHGGGGWTFLNACNDRHGNQWTGLHLQMERLFCLGIAAGKAKWFLPRDMWKSFPGGMPFVQVTL